MKFFFVAGNHDVWVCGDPDCAVDVLRPSGEFLSFLSDVAAVVQEQVETWQVRLREEEKPHDLLAVWQEENERVYGAFELGLSDGRRFLAGDDYSIADIAAFPWIHRWKMQEITLGRFPAVSDWYARVARRDAVKRGLDVPPRGDGL